VQTGRKPGGPSGLARARALGARAVGTDPNASQDRFLKVWTWQAPQRFLVWFPGADVPLEPAEVELGVEEEGMAPGQRGGGASWTVFSTKSKSPLCM
jgi:hypothetical protein